MKHKMDERQIQEVNSIASKAFCTMYIICAVSIMIQLIVTDNGLTNVIGETVTILFGGIVYLVGSIRTGIFSIKGNGLTWMNYHSKKIEQKNEEKYNN